MHGGVLAPRITCQKLHQLFAKHCGRNFAHCFLQALQKSPIQKLSIYSFDENWAKLGQFSSGLFTIIGFYIL
jgi:hypothetical protein